jgi:hypothetical protein
VKLILLPASLKYDKMIDKNLNKCPVLSKIIKFKIKIEREKEILMFSSLENKCSKKHSDAW